MYPVEGCPPAPSRRLPDHTPRQTPEQRWEGLNNPCKHLFLKIPSALKSELGLGTSIKQSRIHGTPCKRRPTEFFRIGNSMNSCSPKTFAVLSISSGRRGWVANRYSYPFHRRSVHLQPSRNYCCNTGGQANFDAVDFKTFPEKITGLL